ncbi:phosphotransferase enzyme family protein [Deinococcus aquatilis]|jgi:Ser/Thr protein kinase RdoA (MazF antagonist)|uniref:phosphotransferase enzyme family protein n=1 Tax=Deinococcus aquatilis TaxID=519440 RepID=UPI00039C7E10|nr:phosphotransferase [Deinococcus aquatilis]
MNWQTALSTLTPDLVTAGAGRWGAGDVRPVNLGFNHVYWGSTPAGDIALRFTHSSLRSPDALRPPLDFLRHLHAAGAGVCPPLPSLAGNWIEALPEGFLVTAVGWINGPRVSELPPTPALYRAFGQAIGELHAAGRNFWPTPGTPNMIDPALPGMFPSWRFFWHRAAPHAAKHADLARHLARLTSLVDQWGGPANCWPNEEDSEPFRGEGYGLTHGDLRPGNAIWDGQRVVIIDFDEPVFGPLATDLARAQLELPADLRSTLLPHLIAGYRQLCPLTHDWETRLPLLTQCRAALMAAWTLDGVDSAAEVEALAAPTLREDSGAVVSFGALLGLLNRAKE